MTVSKGKRPRDPNQLAKLIVDIAKTRREVLSAAKRKARQRFIREARRIRSQRPSVTGQFPATEEMLREDRAR
jgi:hypothetical protein